VKNIQTDSHIETPVPILDQAKVKTRFHKTIRIIAPLLILLLSFVFGFIYFFNFDVIARYMIMKNGLTVDMDELNLHLSGKFNIERFKYSFQNRQGITQQIKIEYIGGRASSISLLISKKLNLDINMKGLKLPFESGMISGGSWKILTSIQNIPKNVQQWKGEVEISVEDAMFQYSLMNTNYVASIKSGKIKGHIQNSMLQLETSEILTDIAKITVSGNSTINYPYNLNIQLTMLPLDEFGNKYPVEKNMLALLLQKEPSITINLNGTLDNLNPRIKNLNPNEPLTRPIP